MDIKPRPIALTKERGIGLFENRLLSKVIGLKSEEITRDTENYTKGAS